MKPVSKKIVSEAAQILTRHVTSGTPVGKLLGGNDRGTTLDLVNELLKSVAEGGCLVAAVETDGNVLGFVPRIDVVGLGWGTANDTRPPGPDNDTD